MIFSSNAFMVFFAVVVSLLCVFKNQKARRIILLLSNYFFYGYWDYRFLTLLLFSTVVDYFVAKKITETSNLKTKKVFLVLSILINLGLLGFFKYFNFFVQSFNMLLGNLGLNLSTLSIILPIGISFYTFQSMSYTIDVYRGRMERSKSLLEYALFVGFFPQLLAGPIVRAYDFLPQLKKDIVLKAENFKTGMQIFIFGLVKKVLIADTLAFFIDRVFAGPGLFDSLTIWAAVIAYAIQIYCDFSGYSDMAIGLAKCLGFELTTNFNMPYLSTNLTEFWRKWHISLSSWLRDYLYIPLGGNRKGKVRTYVNLFITMLLGGLWHGASWNFVVWGGLHGTGLAVHKFYSKIAKFNMGPVYKFISWVATFAFVCFGWVFFRAQGFKDAMVILEKMLLINGSGIHWLYAPLVVVIPVVILAHYFGQKKGLVDGRYMIFNLATFSGAFVLIMILLGVFFLAPTNPTPFIYFQF